MKNLKIHTPTGLTDLLPPAYNQKRHIERQIETIFERYGYSFVSSPALEYLAVFEGKGSIPVTEMYKLADRTGDMLALRPDMTPAVARMAVTQKLSGSTNHPVRLCYIEKAFRDHERFRGHENEFTQAGAELMGVSCPEADAELISLAVQGLLASGLVHFRLDIGHVGFMPGILEELGAALTSGDRENFINHMIRRDYVAAEALAAKTKHIIPAGELLSELTQLTGGTEILNRAKKMTTNPKALASLQHLEDVYAILKDQGLSQYVLIDLSMTGQLDYYTGLIFKGYAKGTGSTVVDGGRYDNLLASFTDNGKPIPAVGFGIKIDGLLDALRAQGQHFQSESSDTLLVYEKDARTVALATADIMRKQGLSLINSLQPGSLDANKSYALKQNLKGIIYFANPDKIILINLETGQEQQVSVEELKCMS